MLYDCSHARLRRDLSDESDPIYLDGHQQAGRLRRFAKELPLSHPMSPTTHSLPAPPMYLGPGAFKGVARPFLLKCGCGPCFGLWCYGLLSSLDAVTSDLKNARSHRNRNARGCCYRNCRRLLGVERLGHANSHTEQKLRFVTFATAITF